MIHALYFHPLVYSLIGTLHKTVYTGFLLLSVSKGTLYMS